MQVGFNCLLSYKGIILLMLPLTHKDFNRLLLKYMNTLWLDAYMLTFKPLNVLTLYGLDDMLDITQQNPLKYGFSGIEQLL